MFTNTYKFVPQRELMTLLVMECECSWHIYLLRAEGYCVVETEDSKVIDAVFVCPAGLTRPPLHSMCSPDMVLQPQMRLWIYIRPVWLLTLGKRTLTKDTQGQKITEQFQWQPLQESFDDYALKKCPCFLWKFLGVSWFLPLLRHSFSYIYICKAGWKYWALFSSKSVLEALRELFKNW